MAKQRKIRAMTWKPTPQDREIIKQLATRTGFNNSTILRNALRQYEEATRKVA